MDCVVYGKIIIDSIKLLDGTLIHNQLGGGGPQGAFGARVFNDSVGLLSRVGYDFNGDIKRQLENINVNTEGVVTFNNYKTLTGMMDYDENDYIDYSDIDKQLRMKQTSEAIANLVREKIKLPKTYENPKVIHLITEYMNESIMKEALFFKSKGSILSLEPLIDYRNWSNKDEIISMLPNIDLVSPDWPSACGFAESENPLEVMKWWISSGVAAVSVRHGRKGSYVWDKIHDQIYEIPIIDTPRIDPTGCGNCYAGSFCVGWKDYKDAKIAGMMGTASASVMVQHKGIATYNENTRKIANEMLNNLEGKVRLL